MILFLALSLSAWVTTTVMTAGAWAAAKDSPPDESKDQAKQRRERIKALIKALDAEEFKVRQAASQSLIEFGSEVLPTLEAVEKNGSLEASARATHIIRQIQSRAIYKALVKLAQTKNDQDIDLEEGMWLIACIETPNLKRKTIDQQFDKLADQVRQLLGKKLDPTKISPTRIVNAIRQVIFTKNGFNGDQETYTDPQNSLIDRVLKRKKGLPILLSHVVVATADRLGVPIVGLQIPGRYMVKYDGSRAPKGQPRDDIILDPFGNGVELSVEQVSTLVGVRIDPQTDLQPSPKRDTLTRMLRNLESHYMGEEKLIEAQTAVEFRRLLETVPTPEKPQEQ